MSLSKRVVIAGGTGFLGNSLAEFLTARGYSVVVLSRRPPRHELPWTHSLWDGRTVGPWASHLDGAEAVVNLAGRSVDCVKTPDHCDEILRSRVEATRALGAAVRSVDRQPAVWVQMSTAHRYGDPPEVWCDEDSAFGYGLAPTVGAAWEEEFAQALQPGIRPVVLRTTFVLGRNGGALPRLTKLARWRLGGKVGSGRQGISWIHEEDMNRLFLAALENSTMMHAYIATAPHPVSNTEFMRALRRALGVRIGLPAPAALVRLGAPLVMRTDPDLALYGRYCKSWRLEQDGFTFLYPDIDSALQSLFREPGQATKDVTPRF